MVKPGPARVTLLRASCALASPSSTANSTSPWAWSQHARPRELANTRTPRPVNARPIVAPLM
eukprot:5553247-Lingulodinium_polyedra.AAC.1